MNIGYKLVKNAMSATADKAPYLGMAVPVGSLAYDNILKDMIKTGTRLSLPTARFFLEAFYEFAAERIAEEVVRINTGTVAIYPMIDGSFDSEDAEFDPERNSLYIGATLSQSLRDRVAGIVPDATGDETKGTVKMDRVYDIESQTRGVISGTKSFRISGRNLTVPDAEDESLALYAKDGVTKVTDIVVSETDGGQLITCQLSAAVGVPKGTYKVRIASHGLDPTDPLTVATLTVTLVEAIPAPVPVPIAETPDGQVKIMSATDGGQSETFTFGHEWKIGGVNMFDGAHRPADIDWTLSEVGIQLDEAGYHILGATYAADGTLITVDSSEASTTPEPGTYDDAQICSMAQKTGEVDPIGLNIPIKLVVEE